MLLRNVCILRTPLNTYGNTFLHFLYMQTIVFSCAVHWSSSSNHLPQLSSFSAEGAWGRWKWGWFPWRWKFWSGHTKEEASKQRKGEWWAWLIKVCGWCEGKKASESKKKRKLETGRTDTGERNKTWKIKTCVDLSDLWCVQRLRKDEWEMI